MSSESRFDIRLPIGALFLLLGLILLGYGVVTKGDSALYVRSESIDINLWWGLIMVLFGAIMFYFGSRAHRRPIRSSATEPTDTR